MNFSVLSMSINPRGYHNRIFQNLSFLCHLHVPKGLIIPPFPIEKNLQSCSRDCNQNHAISPHSPPSTQLHELPTSAMLVHFFSEHIIHVCTELPTPPNTLLVSCARLSSVIHPKLQLLGILSDYFCILEVLFVQHG